MFPPRQHFTGTQLIATVGLDWSRKYRVSKTPVSPSVKLAVSLLRNGLVWFSGNRTGSRLVLKSWRASLQLALLYHSWRDLSFADSIIWVTMKNRFRWRNSFNSRKTSMVGGGNALQNSFRWVFSNPFALANSYLTGLGGDPDMSQETPDTWRFSNNAVSNPLPQWMQNYGCVIWYIARRSTCRVNASGSKTEANAGGVYPCADVYGKICSRPPSKGAAEYQPHQKWNPHARICTHKALPR